MRKVFGALTLTALLACSANADGVIPNGNQPPPQTTSGSAVLPYESETPSTFYQAEDGPAPADTAADITILLVSGVLSLF
ncbi:MAG TPA: hypothetical protein VGX48_14810 [Pyrinomonadaceae bacterium]|nr:hypothetical protein [Pyrinomonadaceae bacterium]